LIFTAKNISTFIPTQIEHIIAILKLRISECGDHCEHHTGR